MLHKKIFGTILPCALALALLTACGGSHTHSAASDWSVDLENHWHACAECGETVDSAAHTLENDVCTVCGTEIVVWEDGSSLLVVYNEHGYCTLVVSYAADGSVEYEDRYEFEYDADGNIVYEKAYSNGVLSGEFEYALNADGELYISKDTYYYEDGSVQTSEYSANNQTLRSAYITADGTVESEYLYEYSADGSWMSEKFYYGGILSAENEYSLDADGWTTPLKEITYEEDGSWMGIEYDLYGNAVIEICSDADGNVTLDRRYEYTYDADGNFTLVKIYDNGVLVEETEYIVGSDEDGSWSMSGKSTIYHEDGSKTVSNQDPEMAWATETTYDADGNVVTELRYEYEYNEDGDQTSGRSYENGRLFEEITSVVDENGDTTGILMIAYHEDGSKTIQEYDTFFDLVKETVYDASGHVISGS